MTRVATLVLALAVVCGAWFARHAGVAMRAVTNEDVYAGVDDSASAYRMRLIELSLATRHAPHTDRFLDHPLGAEVPFPPLVHALIASVASFALDGTGGPELARVGEDALERMTGAIAPVLGALATLFALALGCWIAPARRRAVAGFAAAALYAFAPTSVAREVGGSLHAQPWIAVLAMAQVAALAFALRAREQVDLTLGALLAGACSAFCLLAGPEAWPLSAAALGVLIARAIATHRTGARDSWRAAVLFLLVTTAIVTIADPGRTLERFWPEFVRGGQVHGLPARDWSTLALAFVAFPATWVALFAHRRDPLHAVLLAAGFLSFACSLFDARFLAVWNVAFALSLAAVVGQPPPASRQRARVTVALAVAAVLIGTLGYANFASLRRARDVAGDQAELARGLYWLRDNATSPGPFNNPDAPQDWCVLTAPALAGSVAYYARKPVAASSIDGASTAGCAGVREALQAKDAFDFGARAAAARALYLVLTPAMHSDPSLAAMVGDAQLAGVGFERVYASQRTLAGGAPVLAIWRLGLAASEHDPQLAPAKH